MPAGFTDWATVAPNVRAGEKGSATVRAQSFGGIQLRLIQYSPGYVGSHWCLKGHIVHVIDGEVSIEHRDGPTFNVKAGMSYHVSDHDRTGHRLSSKNGASVFIVD